MQRLERARSALRHVQIADEQCETLARNYALRECRRILGELNRDVDPAQPYADVLGAVFTVGVQRIDSALRNFESHSIELVQRDVNDLLSGFRFG